ncbi:hypothetical protein MNV49_004541 [Pseudohyphozyma bogoriensis]|nr:hypothetical protein MNV49_004541 [Pseudohyphozyma bogoriensis]
MQAGIGSSNAMLDFLKFAPRSESVHKGHDEKPELSLFYKYIYPPNPTRTLDNIQKAAYEVLANDLLKLRKSQRSHGPWANTIQAARNNPLFSFARSLLKTAQGIVFALAANPSAPIESPIGFLYSVWAYSVIFTALSCFLVFITIFDLFGGEFVVEYISNRWCGGLSFVNWGGARMFEDTVTVHRGIEFLGSKYDDKQGQWEGDLGVAEMVRKITHRRVKVFDIDVARTLLLFSASVYEREPAWVQAAANYRPYAPGLLEKSEDKILDFSDTWGIKYVSVSDCVNVGGAYAGAFYSDGYSTANDTQVLSAEPWICVVFKGTGPASMAEWLIDATCAQENAQDYLTGSCHQGFYTTLFPANGSQLPVLPYRRITDMVTTIAHQLRNGPGRDPARPINVFVTGHSLGAGLASLYYAESLQHADGLLKKGVLLRDCYVYGCPNVGGGGFLAGFEQELHKVKNDQRSYWKVTNDKDIVATVPPGLASNRSNRNSLRASSLLNYGPMGIEVKMQPHNHAAPFYEVAEQAQPGTKVELRECPAERGSGGHFFGTNMTGIHPAKILTVLGDTFMPFLADHSPVAYHASLTHMSGDARAALPRGLSRADLVEAYNAEHGKK